MKKLLISACLLGERCRYDGASMPLPDKTITELKRRFCLIPVCPEVLGGLPTPRNPAEISGDKVVSKAGTDVTAEYLSGAEKAKAIALENGCKLALLKAKSPSCGSKMIYDGSFSGRLIPGRGKTAEALHDFLTIYHEAEIEQLLKKAD